MIDLTKITTPFGLLDKETQDALRAWQHGVEEFAWNGWRNYKDPIGMLFCRTYRARPAPAIPDQIDWSHVAPEWKFMARDEDGTSWLYEVLPHLDGDIWYAECRHADAPTFASYKRGTVAWQDSLVVRPSAEDEQ